MSDHTQSIFSHLKNLMIISSKMHKLSAIRFVNDTVFEVASSLFDLETDLDGLNMAIEAWTIPLFSTALLELKTNELLSVSWEYITSYLKQVKVWAKQVPVVFETAQLPKFRRRDFFNVHTQLSTQNSLRTSFEILSLFQHRLGISLLAWCWNDTHSLQNCDI